MLIEVPAHVKHESHVQNSIHVQGGTNWDISRAAVPTPIAELPPARIDSGLPKTQYHPVHQMPTVSPDAVIRFAANGAVLSSSDKKTLKEIDKGQAVVIAGHADSKEKSPDTVSKKRAEAVAKYLKSQGVTIHDVRYFGATTPQVWEGSTLVNRRVEIFIK